MVINMINYINSIKLPDYKHIYLVVYKENGKDIVGYQFSDEVQTFLSSGVYSTAEEANEALINYIKNCL